ncbi:unnamed protein product [Cylicocyclus nassatus]|uniref:N-acetylgalactosaminide beta-1,3-galactosyltransferase n=1 Tax=Cylicocyclus nassatus TaxID=53992 RepID=A0AA36GEM6_CYLNA|nr:unnamed protein product [Cylicocyclus nassatus]
MTDIKDLTRKLRLLIPRRWLALLTLSIIFVIVVVIVNLAPRNLTQILLHLGCKTFIGQSTICHPTTVIRDMNFTLDDVYMSDAALHLPKKGRLFCFVITTPRYHNDRVLAVNETWLPRCDSGQFFTSEKMDPSIPHSTILSKLPDTYEYLFYKVLLAFHYAYNNVSDQFDWYFKADDDTYVIMEHMYEYLATLDPSEPYYLGYTLKPYLARGYNGGGAGYVLSRAAVKLLLQRGYDDRKACPFDYSEDVGMGMCLQNMEIYPHDTRNERGQQRFHTYRPDDMFHGKITDEWHYYRQINGHDWIAPELITIHHLTPDEIRTYDDLLYRMRSPQLSKINAGMEKPRLTPNPRSNTSEKRQIPKSKTGSQTVSSKKLKVQRLSAFNHSHFDIEAM